MPRTDAMDQNTARDSKRRLRDGQLLAAIDLGSNSFRLEIARHHNGQLLRNEYVKETVRQGIGLDEAGNLDVAALRRGWDCLARFAERLRGFEPRHVRAVATQTLREAGNRETFISEGAKVLGFPIEVISGYEEARLIYSGVAHLLPESDERRLVVDIGGRSTEIILGQGYEALRAESYPVGSVGWSMRHFRDGKLSAKTLRQAEMAAQAAMEECLGYLDGQQWHAAYGASGTVGAVSDVLQASQVTDGTITADALRWLTEQLLAAGHVDRVRLPGMKEDRRPVLAGGVTVLTALFGLLGLQRMASARGALRHGVLYEMLDRATATQDVRGRTVKRLARTFGVDAEQAQRVKRCVLALYEGVSLGDLPGPAEPGESDSPEAMRRRAAEKLGWAAELHEIGLAISHTGYHRHGAYILEHADAAGFAQHQLHRLGLLLLGQRGNLRKMADALGDDALVEQLICLRLAILLCHTRHDPPMDGVRLSRHGRRFTLLLPDRWAQRFPRSMLLLEGESEAWSRTSTVFSVVHG
jgi:exopolyphosphatase/guanosine-5'-triphosphate,3'-diphosphate pyrophosphatase